MPRPRAVAAMRTLGIGGFAVTTPHKADVATAVDEVDAAAAALRSVNTVVLRDDGSTFGASTDGDGFVDSLLAAGCEPHGRRVVVLGAGGAARSIVDALGRAGVADLAVVNRSRANAEAAATLAPLGRIGGIDDIAGADVLINATSVGMGNDDLAVPAEVLHVGLTVADIVYHPLETALLRAAAAAAVAPCRWPGDARPPGRSPAGAVDRRRPRPGRHPRRRRSRAPSGLIPRHSVSGSGQDARRPDPTVALLRRGRCLTPPHRSGSRARVAVGCHEPGTAPDRRDPILVVRHASAEPGTRRPRRRRRSIRACS